MTVKNSKKVLLGGSAVAIVSIAWSYIVTTDQVRVIAALPAVGALLTILLQLLRDQSHQQHLETIQRREQFFGLSVTSHMASVVFDKHVGFCESYLEQLNATLRNLFRLGPSKAVLEDAGKLHDIRMKHAAWITPEIQTKLQKFERALDEIGVTDIVLQQLKPGEERAAAVAKMYNIFARLTGIGSIDESDAHQLEFEAADLIVQYVRGLLGVDKLTVLRSAILERAIDSLDT